MGAQKQIVHISGACESKRNYGSRGAAIKAIKRWRRRSTFQKRTGYVMGAYFCVAHRAWHVGHLEARRTTAVEFEG